jgi:SPP1 gp7 family putative phage head morphogenesis protein
MESAYKRGEKSVLDWIKLHHSDYGAKDLSVGIKEGNPSAASFMKFQAFTTAAVQDQRIRTRMQAALAGNLKRGENKEDFRKVIDAEFDRAGLTRLNPSQISNIYYTNTSLAFGAGQMGKMIEVSGDFPYWKYSATMDSKTRPDHAALHGKIFRTGDFTFWPPIGFRCRCTAIPLTARQAGQYLKTAMPTAEERQNLLTNTGNAEFLGNKQENYMKWIGKQYAKADEQTKAYIDKAFETMRSEIDSLQGESLKQFFSDDFVKTTWDKFRTDQRYTIAAQVSKLTTKQAYYIHAYTHDAPLYSELNAFLFAGKQPENFSKNNLFTMKRSLATSLKKLPKYEGVCWRYVPKLPANVLNQYKPGRTCAWDGFSSATTKPNLFNDRNIEFTIQSKSSRPISQFSEFEGQKETLFLPGSKFKVTNRSEQGNKVFIELEEI